MNRQLFLKAINTMLFSGGGDPGSEVLWALDEFLDFYEGETGEDLGRTASMEELMYGNEQQQQEFSRIIDQIGYDGISEEINNFKRLM